MISPVSHAFHTRIVEPAAEPLVGVLRDLGIQAPHTPVVANVISLAAIVEISGICSRDSLEKAVLGRAPYGTEDKNKLACKVGFELGKKAKENG